MAARGSRARPYSRSNMNAIGIDSTPSLLYNNLSSNGDRAVRVVAATCGTGMAALRYGAL